MGLKNKFLASFILLLTLGFSGQKVTSQCYQMKLRPVFINGKYGAIDIKTGKLVIKPQFAMADSFPGNYLLVSKGMDKSNDAFSWHNSLWNNRKPQELGLVNEKGKVVLPMKYRSIFAIACDNFIVNIGTKTQLLDKNFNVIYEDTAWFYSITQANRIFSEKKLNDTLKEFTLKDLKTGKVYFQTKAYKGRPVFDYFDNKNDEIQKRKILPFFEITIYQRRKNRKVNLTIIDANGKTIIDSLINFQVFDGLALLEQKIKGKEVKLVADTNFQIIPHLSYKKKFPKPESRAKGWYSLEENGKHGVIDLQGKIIMPFSDKGRYFYAGKNAFLYLEPGTRDSQKIIFTNGRSIDLSSYEALDTGDTLILHRPMILYNWHTQKSGLMDLNGKLILPAVYNGLSYASSDLLFFTKDQEYGFITTSGKTIRSGKYVAMAPFNEGMRLIYMPGPDSTNCQAAFFDTAGNLLPGFYKNASSFKGGYAKVIQNGKTFMIDKQGHKVSFGNYPLYSHFYHDIAVISNAKQTRFGIVHKSGKILIRPKYAEIITEDPDTDCSYHALASHVKNLQVLPILTPKLMDGKIQVSAKVKKIEKYLPAKFH